MDKIDYDRRINEIHHLFRNKLLVLKQESHGCQRRGCLLVINQMWNELETIMLANGMSEDKLHICSERKDGWTRKP